MASLPAAELNNRQRFAAFGKRYERVIDEIMVAFALVYLVDYSFQVIYAEDAKFMSNYSSLLSGVDWVIYWIFAAGVLWNFAVFLATAKSERNFWQWFRENLLGIIALIPAISAARSLRLMRLVMLLRGVSILAKTHVAKTGWLIILAMPLTAYIAALAVLDAERSGSNPNITNIGDAVWWAIVTMTMVGYGDYYPLTIEGRVIATVMLAFGIILISTVTAMVAAALIEASNKLQESKPNKR